MYAKEKQDVKAKVVKQAAFPAAQRLPLLRSSTSAEVLHLC